MWPFCVWVALPFHQLAAAFPSRFLFPRRQRAPLILTPGQTVLWEERAMAPSIYSHSCWAPLDTSLSSMKGEGPPAVQEQRGRRTRTGPEGCPVPSALGSRTPHSGCLLHVGKWPGLLTPGPGRPCRSASSDAGRGHGQPHAEPWVQLVQEVLENLPGPLEEVTGTQGKRGRVPGKSQGATAGEKAFCPWSGRGGKISMALWGDGGCAKLSMLAGPGKPHKEFDFVPEGSGELRRSVGRERPASRLHWTL